MKASKSFSKASFLAHAQAEHPVVYAFIDDPIHFRVNGALRRFGRRALGWKIPKTETAPERELQELFFIWLRGPATTDATFGATLNRRQSSLEFEMS